MADVEQFVTVSEFAPVVTMRPAPSMSEPTEALVVFNGLLRTPVDGIIAGSDEPGTPDELQFEGLFQSELTAPVQTRGFVLQIVTSFRVGVTVLSVDVKNALYCKYRKALN